MVEVLDAGPKQVGGRAIINAPVEELFAMAIDPYRHGELDGTGTVQRVLKGDHRMVEGQPFTMAMKVFGIPYRVTSTPTRIVENEVIEWRSMGGQRWRWEFKALDAHRTEVSEFWDQRYMNPILAAPGKLFGEAKTNQKAILSSLSRLQQRFNS